MKKLILAAGVLLAACASQPVSETRATLTAADASTSLAVGERVAETLTSRAAGEGMDPVVTLTLRHADGRTLSFQEGNHTNDDLAAQAAGGPLAQIMGLQGQETTTLYHAVSGERGGSEAAFFCGPQGPAAIGRYDAPDGSTRYVGLREPIQWETRPDGQPEAVPYSPDAVCARLQFRRG
ncbi:MAG: hypothetical protein JNL81_12785 [Hyphomonadaceae bacterium]|nr:hypothetical protein [Hyphomonadaceae bacterium]